MREIERSTVFKRDYKREKKGNPALDSLLIPVLEMLAADEDLPERLRDHALIGPWKDFRDCHIRPDLVLIYARSGESLLTLARLGSHSELFG